MFACGILIAISRHKGPMLRSLLLAISFAAVVCARHPSPESAARIAIIVAVFYLLHNGSLPSFAWLERALGWLRQRLGNRVGHFLGEMSYSVYLIHLLVLIPVSAALLGYEQYAQAPGIVRYAICLLITIPAIYGLAALLHVTIEQPGIRYGKNLAAAIRTGKPAKQRTAIAYPVKAKKVAPIQPVN
jgi:peptidoglycan/LPS O-acetylase OafA/YrhL